MTNRTDFSQLFRLIRQFFHFKMSSSEHDQAQSSSGSHASARAQIDERTRVAGDSRNDGASTSHGASQSRPQHEMVINDTNTDITNETQSTHQAINGESNHISRPDHSHVFTPAPPLASSRYNRQLLIPSISLAGHERIARSKILIIGLGGLGSPAALYLAGAGVGTLGLMDDDRVELSNLHRQIAHSEASVREGLGKVESAARACKSLNGEIEVVGHEMRCDVSGNGAGEKLFEVVGRYDVVLDCTDNPATRYLISDVCVLLGKVLVSGAAQRLEGQLCLLNYPVSQSPLTDGRGNGDSGEVRVERGPCYRCVFPTPPSPEMVKGCGEIGILGPVVGTIGTLMASEALRFVVKDVEVGRKPSMLLYNAWSVDPRGMFRSIALRGRRKDCVACGDDEVLTEKGGKRITKEEVIKGRWNYARFCGILEDVKLLGNEERVSAKDFLNRSGESANLDTQHSSSKDSVVIDVREPHEVDLGPKIEGSVNIPISKILRKDGTVVELDDLLRNTRKSGMVFVCQQGNDSQIAAKKLLDFRKKLLEEDDVSRKQESREMFIGDVVGGFVAMERELT